MATKASAPISTGQQGGSAQPPPPPAYNAPPPGQGYGAPPPGQGYGAPPPGQSYGAPVAGYPVATTSTVVFHQSMPRTILGEAPCHMNCPHCRATIVTRVNYETGTLTWIICLILAFVGCWLGCCLIPFCINGCKDAVHTCPNCNQMLGVFRRL